jgi:hypothetical protein
MMQSWADYLDTLKSGKSADVIPIRRSLNTWLLSFQEAKAVLNIRNLQMRAGTFMNH